jgi:hypothetical protein
VITDELIAAMEPWWTDDLITYLTTIGTMFSQAESVIRYDPARLTTLDIDPETMDEDFGYGNLLDPNLSPPVALPYLGQFVGERMPSGLATDAQRAWIADRPHSRRGTVLSLVDAVQRSLTGTKTVTIVERNDGSAAGDMADDVAIYVYQAETPSSAQVLSDIQDTFPLELSLSFNVIVTTVWAQVLSTYTTWANVKSGNANWGEVRSKKTGGISYGQ